MMQKPLNSLLNGYFLSQPHQPFFLLGFLNAIVGMLLFMLSYKGVITLTLFATTLHSYSMLFLLFTPAFIAFLFTTFPRFGATQPIKKERYVNIFALFALASLLIWAGALILYPLAVAGMVLLLIAHLLAFLELKKIYQKSLMDDKHDLFWILTGMGFGVASHLFMAASLFFAPLTTLATQTGVYLYLFLVAFSVAQRMVPFFSHCMNEKNIYLLKVILTLLMIRVVLQTLYTGSAFFVDAALAYITAKEIIFWKLPFPNPNPLLWILHIALFWVPTAFAMGAMTQLAQLVGGVNLLFLDIHALMLGFLLTILIGFGTRVTIGHSGNMMQAGMWEKVLFNWTQAVVVMRLFVSVAAAYGWNFMPLFDLSVTLWLLLFILWGVRFFKVLIGGKTL